MTLRCALATTAVLALTALAAAGTASAAPRFAPASTAAVHPGVQTLTKGGQCTSNFIYIDDAGKLFIGQAAHCSGTGSPTETNGCDSGSLPIGTKVEIEGADKPGTLAYNSWLKMQAVGEKDENTCQYNDLALVAIDPADYDKVNPTVPFFGGPAGLADSTSLGDSVFSYGNSSLRLGLSPLSPKIGKSLGQDSDGWNHTVYTVTPGVPGDSGSGFLDAQGRAFGVLSTIGFAPLPASNGVGDLSRELRYAADHGFKAKLVNGDNGSTGSSIKQSVAAVTGVTRGLSLP